MAIHVKEKIQTPPLPLPLKGGKCHADTMRRTGRQPLPSPEGEGLGWGLLRKNLGPTAKNLGPTESCGGPACSNSPENFSMWGRHRLLSRRHGPVSGPFFYVNATTSRQMPHTRALSCRAAPYPCTGCSCNSSCPGPGAC